MIEQRSWEEFLAQISMLFDSGKSEAEISDHFAGSSVEWEGVVTEVKLSEEYAPGIALSMHPETFPLAGGKVMRADYQYLNIDPDRCFDWSQCAVGDKIRFSAKISKSEGPFPAIQISEFDGDLEVVLMIGLYDCALLTRVKGIIVDR